MAKPILFNTEMVRAILEGRKTATRRVVKGQKNGWELLILKSNDVMVKVRENAKEYKEKYVRLSGLWATFVWDGIPELPMVKAPYEPGDILWVRETWSPVNVRPRRYIYKADVDRRIGEGVGLPLRWHPSIHMPREAARIFLRVTDVRVERLQSMSHEDAEQEGCWCDEGGLAMPRDKFAEVWDSTIKPKDRPTYGWEANPWVWAIEFERCEKPEGWPC